jgi:uncharacterized membrane protein
MKARPLDRLMAVLAGALLALLVVRTFHWYPLLPDRFPIHFNGAGEPDGWANKGGAWFLGPGLALVMGVLLFLLAKGLPSSASRSPASVNLTRKDLFIRLSTEGRASVMAPTSTFLLWVVALLQLLFLYIVEGMGRMATGAWNVLPVWPVFLFLAGVIGALPFLIRAINRSLAHACEKEGIAH